MKLLRLVPLLLFVAPAGAAASGGQLWGLTNTAEIRIGAVDPATGVFSGGVQVVASTGEAAQKGTGLAAEPATGTLWAVLKLVGQSSRILATLDPATGIATAIGDLGDKFAGITFDNGGTLWGITGDGATQPSSLFTIDKSTAAPTFKLALDSGDDGETIAFRPDDGLIYRMSGLTTPVLQAIDPGTLAVTPIPLSGVAFEEASAIVHVSGASFLFSDITEAMYDLSASGVVGNQRSQNPWIFKGLAFGPPGTATAGASWGAVKAGYR